MASRGTPASRGLSASEIRAEAVDVTFLVWLTSRATADLVDAVLAPAGLDGDEFAIYSMLKAAPGMTPTDLARWMAAAPTTVSSYVKRFEARGHVTREPNPADGRSYRLRLTPAGVRAHRTAERLFRPLRTQLEDGLGEEEPRVHDALLTLRTALDRIRNSDGTEPSTRVTTR